MLEQHSAADGKQCHRKDAPQPLVRDKLRSGASKVSTDEEADCQKRRNANVSGALAIVFDESQNADRREKRAQRCALGLVLAHSEQPNQCGNEQDASADSNHAGECSNYYPY